MAYEAIVTRITTKAHPNADRLQIAEAAGYTCIIGLAHSDGDLGIVFPEGGQLVEDFCMANKLYRKHPETGEPMGGYLESNRRIRALKLRGVESDALWLPMSAVGTWLSLVHQKDGKKTGAKLPVLDDGVALTEIMGHKLCGKYYTPATIKAMRSKDPKERKVSREALALERHYDTPQLRSAQIPTGKAIITEKLHGTSGRTGFVEVEQELNWFLKALNYLPFVSFSPKKQWQFVSGTRNCIVNTSAKNTESKSFRVLAHDLIAPHLERDEVWYYELVGFEGHGTPIMARQPIAKVGDSKLEKKLKKKAGDDHVVYHYGCDPDGRIPNEDGDGSLKFKIFVYRITLGGKELTWSKIKDRVTVVKHALSDSNKDFLNAVPELSVLPQDSWSGEYLRKKCEELTVGEGLDGVPVREGVCVRVESDSPETSNEVVVHKALKHKGWLFSVLEGIARNNPDFVDQEEVA